MCKKAEVKPDASQEAKLSTSAGANCDIFAQRYRSSPWILHTRVFMLTAMKRQPFTILKGSLFTGLFLFLAALSSFAQTPSVQGGIELFKKGEYQAAVNALKDSKNIKDLYFLGLAYEHLGLMDNAGNAFDRSFMNGYKLIEKELLASLKPKKKSKADVIPVSKKVAGLAETIGTATASAKKAFRLQTRMMQGFEWTEKGNFLERIDEILTNGEPIYGNGDEFEKRIKTITKPLPKYATEVGNISFLAVLSPDGKIAAAPFTLMGERQSEQSYRALLDMTYEPAVVNGKPVTLLSIVYYEFR